MEQKIKGLASGLIQEIIKADMTMQEGQLEAWKWMVKHRPRGTHINRDIWQGFPQSRYLAVKEVTFSFNIKPTKTGNIFQRLKLAFSILRGTSKLSLYRPTIYEFCSDNDEDSQKMTIKINRMENGLVKASYGPADNTTKEIMSNTPK